MSVIPKISSRRTTVILAVAGLACLVVSVSLILSSPGGEPDGDTAAPVPARTVETTTSQDPAPTIPSFGDDESVMGPVVRMPVVYVSPSGDDRGDGQSPTSAVASLEAAAKLALPGDEIRLAAGVYPGNQRIQNLHGTADEPIRISGVGAQTVFDSANMEAIDTLRIEESSHLVLEDFVVTSGIHGTFVTSSDHIVLDSITWRDIGQEALAIQGTSVDVLVRNCTIANTGLRGGRFAQYGEAIYVGASDGLSPVRDIVISGCDISNITAEAVDIKPGSTRVTVSDNRIRRVNTWNSGAIVAYIGRWNYDFDPEISIHSNVISDVTTTSPYTDGNAININSAATIYNNVMFNLEHRGVIVQGTFDNAPGEINIFNNTIYNAQLAPVELWSDTNRIAVVNNIGVDAPGNIPASSELFEDAAGGDFRLVDGSAAIDQASGLVAERDILGHLRNSGAGPDVGAHEFVTASPVSSQQTSTATPQPTTAPTTTPTTTASTSDSSRALRPSTTSEPSASTAAAAPGQTSDGAPTTAARAAGEAAEPGSGTVGALSPTEGGAAAASTASTTLPGESIADQGLDASGPAPFDPVDAQQPSSSSEFASGESAAATDSDTDLTSEEGAWIHIEGERSDDGLPVAPAAVVTALVATAGAVVLRSRTPTA